MDLFHSRIRYVRKNKNFTQEDLAKKAKTTIANISGYETGHQNPSLNMLVRLSTALECSVDYLLGRSESPHLHDLDKKILVKELYTSDRYSLILEDGSCLTPNEVEEMLEYIQIKRLIQEGKNNKLSRT